jgi:uncharacterized OsmC-like protein
VGKKNLYEYTLRYDKTENMCFSNEAGELEKPENSISYLLVGILGCMAATARLILKKMRIDNDAVIIKGRLYMLDETVRYSNRIECTMSLENAPTIAEDVKKRIVEMTEKNCTVSVTIANNPNITLTID